jgi:hypothetical protein
LLKFGEKYRINYPQQFTETKPETTLDALRSTQWAWAAGENTKRTTFNAEYFYVANDLMAAITP